MKKRGLIGKILIVFIILLLILIIISISYFLFKSSSNKYNNQSTSTIQGNSNTEGIIIQGCSNTDCENLKINEEKDKAKTIDILFIPADMHYGTVGENYIKNSPEPITIYSKEDFLNDINNIINQMFSIEPYSQYKDKFNIYIFKENAKCFIEEDNSQTCTYNNKGLTGHTNYPHLEEFGYFDIYIITLPGEGGGSGGGTGLTVSSGKTPLTTVHEISHFFGLDDEVLKFTYSDMGKSTNICGDFICCGRKLCDQSFIDELNDPNLMYPPNPDKEETEECCIPTAQGSLKYTVNYKTLMKWGLAQSDVLSGTSIRIIDYQLKNWQDVWEISKNGYDIDESKIEKFYNPISPKKVYLEDLS